MLSARDSGYTCAQTCGCFVTLPGVAHGQFGLGSSQRLRRAGGAALRVRAKGIAIGLRQLAIGVKLDAVLPLLAAHCAFLPAAESGLRSVLSIWRSSLRPRASRDITVPSGTARTSEIS